MYAKPIELEDMWKAGAAEKSPSVGGHRHSHLALQFSLSSRDLDRYNGTENSVVRSGDIITGNTFMDRLVVHPDSGWHLAWIAVQCLLIGYDAVTIPLLVFDTPETLFSVTMAWGSASFWILDMVVQNFVGFHADGVVDMRPPKIWRRYVRAGLPVDLPVNMIDWCLLVLEEVMSEANTAPDTAGIFRMSKASRAYRLLRLFRLVRLLKLMSTLGNLLDQMLSHFVRVVVRLVRLVSFLLLMVHYIACMWYFLGSTGSAEDSPSWIRSRNFERQTHGELYANALHWTLSQFTPATIDIAPTNFHERVFAICVVFFVVIVFSSLVSSITTVVTFLRNLNSDKVAEEARIQEYLTSRQVSLALGNRVWHYFRQRSGSKSKRLHEKDIAFFMQLPEGLQMQLRVEAFMPTLSLHPLFKLYGRLDEGALVLICHLAVSEHCLWPNEEAYLEGTEAAHMLWIVSGRIEFRPAVGKSAVLGPGQWACEAAIWCSWQHLGRAKATALSELVSVDAKKFQTIAAQRSWSVDRLQRYAALYTEQLAVERSWEAVDGQDFPTHRRDVARFCNNAFKDDRLTSNQHGEDTEYVEKGSRRSRSYSWASVPYTPSWWLRGGR